MVHGFSYCFIWTHDMQNLHSLKFKNGVTDSNFRQKKKKMILEFYQEKPAQKV
jgi:hypothetical protein